VSTVKKNDEIIALEKRKVDILGKEERVKEDDDLMYECFKSLVLHMKCLPHIRPHLHGTDFSLNTSVSHCQCHSTSVPYSFIHLSLMLYNLGN
jgi:hypothetical protein